MNDLTQPHIIISFGKFQIIPLVDFTERVIYTHIYHMYMYRSMKTKLINSQSPRSQSHKKIDLIIFDV